MRFQSPMAVVLAASITVSGCIPFQNRSNDSPGSYRQAPTSELLSLADRYERQGQYTHAARLYEEMLRNDPSRTQVRTRLEALAAHGIVSPHTQGALYSNLNEVLTEHQRQLAAAESRTEGAEPDRQLASTSSQTPSPFYETSFSPEPVATPATARSTIAPETAAFPPPPTTRASEVAEGPENWNLTQIRSQEDARPFPQGATSGDSGATESGAPSRTDIAHAVNAGSNLWRTSQPTLTQNPAADAAAIAPPSLDAEVDWATTANVEPSQPVTGDENSSDAWWMPSEASESTDAVAMVTDEQFYDPIVTEPDQGFAWEPTDSSDQSAMEELSIEAATPMQRAQSAFTLWQVSGDATEALPVLTELLAHEDEQTVELACYFLGELGPAAQSVATQLQIVRDSAANETTTILAAEALVKIDPSQTDSVNRIINASRSTHRQSRLLAAMTLATIDQAHSEAVVSALARLLDDENFEVRSAAALSLGGLGSAAIDCTPKLEELALGDVPEVSEAARIALQCIEQ